MLRMVPLPVARIALSRAAGPQGRPPARRCSILQGSKRTEDVPAEAGTQTKNEKGSFARREAALNMVSGRKCRSRCLTQKDDYRVCSVGIFTDLATEP